MLIIGGNKCILHILRDPKGKGYSSEWKYKRDTQGRDPKINIDKEVRL